MGHIAFRTLFTERLVLRAPEEKDYVYQFDFMSDKTHFPYADYPVAKSMNDIRIYFDKINNYHLDTAMFWMVCLKDADLPIGTLSAWNADFERQSIEFGYSLYPAYRGQGYMFEALSEVIRYCAMDLGFEWLDIWTEKNNLPAIRLAERLGFDFQGYVVEKAKYSDGDIMYATFTRPSVKGFY